MNSAVNIQKTCPNCGEVKLLEAFSKRKVSKDGYQSKCRDCEKEYYKVNKETINNRQAKYRQDNPDKRRKTQAKYDAKTKDKSKEYHAKYYLANVERVSKRCAKYYQDNIKISRERCVKYYHANLKTSRESRAKYQKANLDKGRARANKRRAIKLLAIPSWLTKDDYKAMEAIYAEAKRLEAETGLIYHVDHIHPLQGKLICGLHCPANLQILTDSENFSKRNKFTPYVESERLN